MTFFIIIIFLLTFICMLVGNHLRLRRCEECDDRSEDYAQQHQTLVVDTRLVLEQGLRLRLRSVGVLREEEKQDDYTATSLR